MVRAKQLPLIQLGDHTKYDLYQQKFTEIHRSTTAADPLGRQLYRRVPWEPVIVSQFPRCITWLARTCRCGTIPRLMDRSSGRASSDR